MREEAGAEVLEVVVVEVEGGERREEGVEGVEEEGVVVGRLGGIAGDV